MTCQWCQRAAGPQQPCAGSLSVADTVRTQESWQLLRAIATCIQPLPWRLESSSLGRPRPARTAALWGSQGRPTARARSSRSGRPACASPPRPPPPPPLRRQTLRTCSSLRGAGERQRQGRPEGEGRQSDGLWAPSSGRGSEGSCTHARFTDHRGGLGHNGLSSTAEMSWRPRPGTPPH